MPRVEFYQKNLDSVNYWLQFAETKNAATIAFVSAVLAIIHSSNIINNEVFKIIITIGYIVSLSISLCSYFPITKSIPIIKKIPIIKNITTTKNFNAFVSDGTYKEKDNYLFWGDIAKYSVDDYLKLVNVDFGGNSENSSTPLEEKYAEEIIINARIAKTKYDLFEFSLKVLVVTTVFIPVFMIIVA